MTLRLTVEQAARIANEADALEYAHDMIVTANVHTDTVSVSYRDVTDNEVFAIVVERDGEIDGETAQALAGLDKVYDED